jgi:nucleoside phosphorylase
MPPSNCDFAIVTVLPEIHARVRKALGLDQETIVDGREYWYGEIASRYDGRPHVVVCGRTTDRFNTPASAFTTDMVNAWRPRYVVVCDIAGGVSFAGVALGDVVVHERLHYFEAQKIVPGQVRERFFEFSPASPVLRERARAVSNLRWQDDIEETDPDSKPEPPKLHEGEIVVGEKVLGDRHNPVVEAVLEKYDNAIAVDMESAGVGYAVLHATFKELFPQFLVVRGISDYFDVDRKGGEDNNATRKVFKPYAAATAAAVLKHLIRQTPAPESAAAMPGADGEFLAGYLARFQRQLNAPTGLFPRSDFLLRFDELHFGLRPTSELIQVCDERQRVVLTGSAGAGKSMALGLLARQLAAQVDPVCVYLDLEQLKPPNGAATSDAAGIEKWLTAIVHASIVDIPLGELSKLAADRPVILLVDGVNEVPGGAAGDAIAALDEFVFNNGKARILVADRVLSERYRAGRWHHAHLRPIPAEEVKGYVDQRFGSGTYAALGEGDDQLADRERALLGLPYFLNIALSRETPALGSRAAAMREFFTRQVGLSEQQLGTLASAAFAAYSELHRRTFQPKWLKAQVGDQLLQSLETAGVLVAREGGEVGFAHQLQHDFLAGRHLATDRSLWHSDVLDQVTFYAESTDPLAQALTVLGVELRDEFLRVVYNWSWYGCVRTMSVVEADGHDSCSASLRTALLALIAEKRFDPVVDTGEQAERLLSHFTDPLALKLASAPDRGSLSELVRSLHGQDDEWFRKWRELFVEAPPPSLATRDLTDRLASDEPVEGWTASNALRRFDMAEVFSELRGMYLGARSSQPASRAIRWRIVHAIGAWADDESADLLLRALDDDEYVWVKYGAVRSLVELAATGSQVLQARVLSDLRDRLRTIPEQPLRELVWSAGRGDVPDVTHWASAVRPLIVQIVADQTIESARSSWDARRERIEAIWREQA